MSRALGRTALGLALGGLAVFAVLPRAASAAPMHRVGAMEIASAAEMTPHAPTEVHVSPDLKRVLQGVLCQCGCNLDAYQCQQTMTCDVSTAMWDQARRLVDDEGKTPERALELFAADYGERVLAAPLKKGFNLTAWGLPIAALLLGGGILSLAVRGWRRTPVALAEDEAPKVEARYLERIERELREED